MSSNGSYFSLYLMSLVSVWICSIMIVFLTIFYKQK